jgi:hypothetical protein
VDIGDARIRARGERANATRKTWEILIKLRCSPRRATAIVQAVLVLHHIGTNPNQDDDGQRTVARDASALLGGVHQEVATAAVIRLDMPPALAVYHGQIDGPWRPGRRSGRPRPPAAS